MVTSISTRPSVHPFPHCLRTPAVTRWWPACRGQRPLRVVILSSKNVSQLELVLQVRDLMVTYCNRKEADLSSGYPKSGAGGRPSAGLAAGPSLS